MRRCNLCRHERLEPVLDLGAHPVAHHFLTNPSEPENRYPLSLLVCPRCGLMQIADPIPPAVLYTEYTCLSAWKPQPHATRIVQMLAALPGVDSESRFLEIGSNDGSFLALLDDAGFSNLLGVEPAVDAAGAAGARGVQTINEYFTPQTAGRVRSERGPCDVLIARQMLEHVSDLPALFDSMRQVSRAGTYVLVEVPDFALCLDELDYSGIWEEHVNYFTEPIYHVAALRPVKGLRRVAVEVHIASEHDERLAAAQSAFDL